MTLDTLGYNADGIPKAQWPGRLEQIAPNMIVDGAHNPAGARALRAYIEQFFTGEPLRLIFGAMHDKAVAEMAAILFPLFEEVILTTPNQSRAMPAQEIATLIRHPNLRVTTSFERPHPDVTTFITGSLFLVAEARAAYFRSFAP